MAVGDDGIDSLLEQYNSHRREIRTLEQQLSIVKQQEQAVRTQIASTRHFTSDALTPMPPPTSLASSHNPAPSGQAAPITPRSVDNRVAPASHRKLDFAHIPQEERPWRVYVAPKANLSHIVMDAEGKCIELACPVCKGNAISGNELLKGLKGLMVHIRHSHPEFPMTQDKDTQLREWAWRVWALEDLGKITHERSGDDERSETDDEAPIKQGPGRKGSYTISVRKLKSTATLNNEEFRRKRAVDAHLQAKRKSDGELRHSAETLHPNITTALTTIPSVEARLASMLSPNVNKATRTGVHTVKRRKTLTLNDLDYDDNASDSEYDFDDEYEDDHAARDQSAGASSSYRPHSSPPAASTHWTSVNQ